MFFLDIRITHWHLMPYLVETFLSRWILVHFSFGFSDLSLITPGNISNRMQSQRDSCTDAVITAEYDKHGSYRFVGNGNYVESPEATREMATILRAWGDTELLAPNLIAIIMLASQISLRLDLTIVIVPDIVNELPCG